MSSEQEIILYKKFHDAVVNIFESRNLLDKLYPLNMEKDKLFLSIVFRHIVPEGESEPDFMNWRDDEWIESMNQPAIYMLSFLLKKDIKIRKIYNIAPTVELKRKLLHAYKNLVRMVKFLESLEKAKQLFIDKSVDLEKIKNKQLQIALNIRNYKDPKNLAYIIDLLYHKQFRNSIVDNIVKGMDKIDVTMLKGFADNEENNLPSLIENFCTQENISKILIFIMTIDIKGDVYINKKLYQNIKNYIHEVIETSDQIQKILNDIENTVKEVKTPYRNKLNVIVLDNTKDLIKECRESTNKIRFNKDLLCTFDSFSIGEYVNFKAIDLTQRIRDLVFIAIQKIIEISALPKEEKVIMFNKYIKEYLIDQIEDDDDFITIDREQIDNTNITNGDVKTIAQKFKEILKDLLKTFSEDEDLRELLEIKDMFVETLKCLLKMDFSNIEKSQFNIVYNLVQKLSTQPNQIRFLIIKLLNTDVFKNFVTKLEEDSSLKINTNLKKKIADRTLLIVQEAIDSLTDITILKDFEKYIFFIAKAIDYILYYILKLKTVNLQPTVVKQKVVIG